MKHELHDNRDTQLSLHQHIALTLVQNTWRGAGLRELPQNERNP